MHGAKTIKDFFLNCKVMNYYGYEYQLAGYPVGYPARYWISKKAGLSGRLSSAAY
jgi:hypothetical protein